MILKLVMILKNDFSAKVIFILFTAGMITCNVNMLTCMLTRLYDDNMQCWHDNKMEILNGIINDKTCEDDKKDQAQLKSNRNKHI